MKNPSLFSTKLMLLTLSLLIAVSVLGHAADTYNIDGDHSMVMFRVKHVGISYTYGRFNEISGSFKLDTADPSKSSVTLEIKAESVDTHHERRDQHLKSPDFFNVKQFPVITFKSKTVKKSDEHSYEVTGDLMLHGVTKPLTIKVMHTGEGKDPWGGYRVGFESSFTIKRSEFGMKFGIGEIAGDEIRLHVSIEGIRE